VHLDGVGVAAVLLTERLEFAVKLSRLASGEKFRAVFQFLRVRCLGCRLKLEAEVVRAVAQFLNFCS